MRKKWINKEFTEMRIIYERVLYINSEENDLYIINPLIFSSTNSINYHLNQYSDNYFFCKDNGEKGDDI